MPNLEKEIGIPTEKSKLKIGEMPTPRYLVRKKSSNGDGYTDWIGIEAYNLKEKIKKFLWWRNFSFEDMDYSSVRENMASFIARIKMEYSADATIGPAINYTNCDRETKYIDIIDNPNSAGIYIIEDKRIMFNFALAMGGLEDANYFIRKDSKKFLKIKKEVLKVLPHFNK